MVKILNWLLIVALVAFAAGACGGDSDSDDVGDKSAACSQIGLPLKIINGVACGDLHRSPIVKIGVVLSVDGANLLAQVCTGSMIANDQVFTAQHCIPVDNKVQGHNVVAIGMVYGEAEASNFVAAKKIDLMPGYGDNSERVFNDAAVLTLARPVDLPVLPVLISEDPEIGAPGWVYGYGQTVVGSEDVPDAAIDFVDLNGGVMRIEDVTPNHIFVRYDGKNSNVCFGDSGGPLVYIYNGEAVIAGVTSQGSVVDCGPGDVTTFTKAGDDAIKDWLQRVATSALFR